MLHRRRGSQLRNGPLRADSGSAAVELAFLAPVLVVLVFFGVQAGLWAYGRSVALQAAREGVSQLRLLGDEQSAVGSQAVVEEHVRQFAGALGRESLLQPRVSTEWSPDGRRVRVTVSGRVVSLVPGLELRTTQSAAGPRESFEGAR